MYSLIETNKPAYQYCDANREYLNQICSPISNLGINYFSYCKIIKNGQFLILCNHLDFLKDWLFTPGGFGSIVKACFEKPEQESYFLTSFDESSLQKDRSLSLLKHHQTSSQFNIFKRDGLGNLTAYFFLSTINDPMFSGFYFKNIPLLEHFCFYFEEKARKLIVPTDKNKFANFYENVNIPMNFLEADFTHHKINQFLFETQLPDTILKKNKQKITLAKSQLNTTDSAESNFLLPLSPRQKDCLFLLTRGKTAKQIGQALGISHRTVETHMISLKNKMNCTTKNQLVEKVFDMNKFSFPP